MSALTNLASKINSLRDRRLLLLFVLLVAATLFVIFFVRPNQVVPPTEKPPAGVSPPITPVIVLPTIVPLVPKEIPGTTTTAVGDLTQAWPMLPATVAVYDITTPSAQPDPLYWPKLFGFDGAGRYMGLGENLWAKDGRIFRLNQPQRSFTYQSQNVVSSGNLTLEQLQGKALTYLKQLGMGPAETSSVNRIRFYKQQELVLTDADNLEEADRVSFYLMPVVNGLPLIAAEPVNEPMVVTLDRAGNLVDLVYHLLDFALDKPKALPLKKPDLAMQELREGRGVVVGIEGLGAGIPELLSQNLVSVKLAYLYPKAGDKQLLPVLVFTGRAVDRGAGRSVPVTVLLWAAVGN